MGGWNSTCKIQLIWEQRSIIVLLGACLLHLQMIFFIVNSQTFWPLHVAEPQYFSEQTNSFWTVIWHFFHNYLNKKSWDCVAFFLFSTLCEVLQKLFYSRNVTESRLTHSDFKFHHFLFWLISTEIRLGLF